MEYAKKSYQRLNVTDSILLVHPHSVLHTRCQLAIKLVDEEFRAEPFMCGTAVRVCWVQQRMQRLWPFQRFTILQILFKSALRRTYVALSSLHQVW